MSRMVDVPAQCVPLRVAWILSICLACLLVHFCGENLAPATHAYTIDWIDSGGTEDQSHAGGEDSFILPQFNGLKILQYTIQVTCPELLIFASFAFRPLLRPPIAN